MDVRGARHVVSLARHLSFTRAAEELGVTQSALSRSLQQIEATSRVRLFDRERGGAVRLTALGGQFVAHAQELLRKSDELDQLLQGAASGNQRKVAFGIGRQPAAALLSRILADEHAAHPELQMHVLVRSQEFLLRLLKEGEIEFFVSMSSVGAPDQDVRAVPIGRMALVCLVRPGHPLFDQASGRTAADYPWIISTSVGGLLRAHTAPHPLRPEPQIILEDIGCAASMTAHSDLIWLTSAHAAAREVQEGRLREIAPAMDVGQPAFDVMLYSVRGRTLSPAAARLKARICDAARRLGTCT